MRSIFQRNHLSVDKNHCQKTKKTKVDPEMILIKFTATAIHINDCNSFQKLMNAIDKLENKRELMEKVILACKLRIKWTAPENLEFYRKKIEQLQAKVDELTKAENESQQSLDIINFQIRNLKV